MPAVSRCARSKSASRADVLQAVDKTHPPASKRETADSQLHNYTYNPPTQSVATWWGGRVFVALGASCLCVCVCAFCSSTAVCARENTALYSQKPGFWLLKNLSFLFCKKTERKRCHQNNNSTNDDNKKRRLFKNCFCQLHLKIWKRAVLKILILLCVCVSNVQSAALKWSDLRYKWQPDMQRDTKRNRRNLYAERSMAIMYIMGLSFLVARSITHHPEIKWHVMWRLLSEVTVVAVRHFFSSFITFLSFTLKKKIK